MSREIVFTEEQEAIFKEVREGKSHIVVEARAGSSKTSSLVHAANFIPKDKSVAFAAFNKHIADELQNKMPNARCMTLNSFGFKCVRDAFGGKIKLNEFKVNDIIKRLVPTYSPLVYISNNIKQLVNLCKYHLYSGANRHELYDLVDKFGVDLGEHEENVFDLVPKIIKKCKEDTKEIDFTDQIWFVHEFNLPVEQFDYFIADESQDFSVYQKELIWKAISGGGRLIVLGDPWQASTIFAALTIIAWRN